MGLLTTTAKAARKLSDEWDEAAWLKENPRPSGDSRSPELTQWYSGKANAKKRAAKDGYDSIGNKIKADNPELDRWDAENPNPVAGVRFSEQTPEQRKLYDAYRQRRARIASPDRAKAADKAKRVKHSEKRKADNAEYRTQNREQILDNQREYYRENKEQAIANNAKRRAAQLDRTPDYSNDEAIKRVYEQAGLLSEATGTPHHVDHVIPLQGENVSGLHVPGNLMITPDNLNLSKSNSFTPGDDPMRFNDVAQRNVGQSNEMGLIGHLASSSDVQGLVNRGYPESVAKRIASGELPMDEASRLARAEAQGYGPLIFRGQRNKIPLEGDQDIWASSSRDVAQTYADSFQEYGGGSVIPVRTDASNLADVNARGKGWRSVETNNRKVPGIETGVHKGTDRISEAVRDSDQYDGTIFRNINDEAVKARGEKADTYNVLGSRDDVNIRHENAAFDPEYNGSNIMGGAAGTAGLAGLLAAGQSEDADAGIIRHGVDDVARLMQIGMLKTDSDKARNGAIKKYDGLLASNPAFAHREEMAGDNLFQTIRQQEEFDVPTLTMEDLKGYTLAPIRSDRSMIGTVDQVGGIEIPRVDVQGGFQFPMKHQGTGRGWGSGESVARGQHSKMQAMGEATGQEVLGIINMMGPDSINFSTPIADIMHSQFASLNKIPAADKLEFDKELRKRYADWPGIDSPESVDWLRGGGDYENIGKKRTAYTTIMGKAKYRDKGFPNYDEAVEAASHTGLKDLAYGDSGVAIYKPDLTRDIYPDDVHDSYSHIMPGEIIGRLEEPVPFSEMFNVNYGTNRGRTSAAGEPYTHDQSIVASNIRKDGYEVADADWYNGIMKYLDGAPPTVRAVGAPGADAGLLSAQLNNHDQAVDQNMMNLGIDPREDPMYEYGSLLPVRENIVTGRSEMAMPSVLRDMIRGFFDVAESPKSGVFRPDGLLEML